MKPTPKDWPRISSALFYEDPAAAIDWLCSAFGFKVRIKVEGPGGAIVHSELEYGEGLIMVGGVNAEKSFGSPRGLGGLNTQSLMVFVDDVDAHCAHARTCGAKIFAEPEDHDYGPEHWTDRSYGAIDPEGHRWWFAQRLRG